MNLFRGRPFAASLLSVLVIGACGQKQRESGSGSGVVVERVEAGYAAARGGLLPEDVLIAWRGEGGDTESEWTPLDSPMDLAVAELEGGQVDSVVMQVRRDDEILSVVVPPSPWKISVRPSFSGDEELRFKSGKRYLAEGRIDEWFEQWQGLGGAAEPAVEVWLSIARARELIEAERGGEAQSWISAALQRAETAGDSDLHAWTWLQVGDLQQDGRDYAAAIEAYTRGSEVSSARWTLAAAARRRSGDARFRSNDYSASGAEFERTRRLWEQRGVMGAEYVAATIGLGKVRRNESQFDRAAELLKEAERLAASLASDQPQVGLALQEQGMLAYWQSDLVAAEERYRAAAKVLGGLGIADNNLAYLYMGRGNVSLMRGELVEAAASFAAARSIFERNSPGGLLVAWSLRGLGAVAWYRNEWGLARRRYEEALRILDPSTLQRMDRAHVLNEVGMVAREQGDLGTAQRMVTEALKITESEYPETMFAPRMRTVLAGVLLDLGEVDAARKHLARALEEWRRLVPNSLDEADTHFQLGELAYHSGELDSARNHHEKALAIRERLAPRSSSEAASHYALGRVALAAGPPGQALAHLEQALQSIEAQLGNLGVSEVSRARFRQRHADAYKATIALLLDMGDREGAFDVLERYRAQQSHELLDLASINLLHTGRPELVRRRDRLEQEYEATWRKLSSADPGPNGRKEVRKLHDRLAELEQERQIVREQLRAADPGEAAADPTPVRWENVGSRLSHATGILSYNVTSDATWLFAVRGSELKVMQLEANGERLVELVDRYRLLLAAEGPGGAGRRALDRYANELYRLLIAPAETLIEPADEIIILPDGPLHLVPFAGLARDSTELEYLVEWKPLSVRSSLAGVDQSAPATSPVRRPGEGGPQLLAFGGVARATARGSPNDNLEVSDFAQLGWPALPFARNEVTALRGLFGSDAEIRLAEEATEEAAKQHASHFRYVHFATHARLDSALPFDSFLLLMSSDASTGGEDGLLRAWEVIEEIPLNADVVTLSACETGLGEEFAGSGLLGLTRAFQLAGARSVVASLWQVNDRSTSALMRRFYSSMRDGLTPSEALRRAQLDLLRGEVTVTRVPRSFLDRLRTRLASLVGEPAGEQAQQYDYSHPHHWAAFQVYEAAD